MPDINLIDRFILNDITLDLAVIQGKTYQISFNYPKDLTGGELCGQIRNTYLQDSGALLGSFNFLPMLYDSGTDKTTITAQLQATVTADIPYTKYQGNGTPSPRNCWVYDIEHKQGTVVRLISRGLVQVKPEVSEC